MNMIERENEQLPPMKRPCVQNGCGYVHVNIPRYYVETLVKITAAGISVAGTAPCGASPESEDRMRSLHGRTYEKMPHRHAAYLLSAAGDEIPLVVGC
jgi:hypothetical protein